MLNWYYSNKGIVFVYKKKVSRTSKTISRIRGFNYKGELVTYTESEIELYESVPSRKSFLDTCTKNNISICEYSERSDDSAEVYLLKKELQKCKEIILGYQNKLEKSTEPIKLYLDTVIMEMQNGNRTNHKS